MSANSGDTRKIIQNGKKPPFVFTCKLCGTKWEHADWRVEEDRAKNLGGMMFFTTAQRVELPTSKCPVCGWTSQQFEEKESEEE